MGYSPWGHKRVRHDLVTKQQRLIVNEIILHSILQAIQVVVFSCETILNLLLSISSISPKHKKEILEVRTKPSQDE